MADEEVKKLELRISQIESLLGKGTTKREITNLSAEEIKAYQKVRDVIAADWGDFCGINDCFRCTIIRCGVGSLCRVCSVCRVCDVECVCGPCSLGSLGGTLRRFEGLG